MSKPAVAFKTCHLCGTRKIPETRDEFVGYWPDDVYHREGHCHPRQVARLNAELDMYRERVDLLESAIMAFAVVDGDVAAPSDLVDAARRTLRSIAKDCQARHLKLEAERK